MHIPRCHPHVPRDLGGGHNRRAWCSNRNHRPHFGNSGLDTAFEDNKRGWLGPRALVPLSRLPRLSKGPEDPMVCAEAASMC